MGKVMEVLKNGVVINRIMCPDDQAETVTLRNPAAATTPQDKAKFESLENELEVLKAENADLRSIVAALEEENADMKDALEILGVSK